MKQNNHSQTQQPLSEWYKVRICMEYVLGFMWLHDGNIKNYTLYEFWQHIQRKIDNEWKEI